MLQKALSQLLNTQVEVIDQRPLGGGCISEVSMVTIESDEKVLSSILDTSADEPFDQRPSVNVVVKRNDASMDDNFRCEASGLRAIEEADSIRVPKVHAIGCIGGHAYLVMQWIRSGGNRATDEDFRRFATQLAELHRSTLGTRIGWECDNYLGSASQRNRDCGSWAEFFAEQRIGYQIRWASDQRLLDHGLKNDCESIMERMRDLLDGRDDATSLLHGDLWSGNYMFDQDGSPVLLDPAVYYGCREADWGMISWFGSCPKAFDSAYQQHFPMPDGWERRVAIYRLYHQLNHLNLFGGSYAGSCRGTAAAILRA